MHNEVRVLASIKHPNIIAFNETFFYSNNLCYYGDGDLHSMIEKAKRHNEYISEFIGTSKQLIYFLPRIIK